MLTESFHGLPQALQENAGILGQIRPHRFLERPFQLITHCRTIKRYVLCDIYRVVPHARNNQASISGEKGRD